MKTIFKTIISFVLLTHASVLPMDTAYTFDRAQLTDVKGTLKLYEASEHAPGAENIIIFPPEVRADIVRGAVEAGKVYVVKHDNEIVGLKKLYQLHGDDLADTLHGELCCIGDGFARVEPNLQSTLIFAGDGFTPVDLEDMPLLPDHLYFYNGADLTREDHRGHRDDRGRGLNAQLTTHALAVSASEVIAQALAESTEPVTVHVVYGLTHANQGGMAAREDNILSGRTHGIARTVAQLMCAVSGAENVPVGIRRYSAKKPEFIIEDGTLKPTFPKESNGDGFVLSFLLNPKGN